MLLVLYYYGRLLLNVSPSVLNRGLILQGLCVCVFGVK